MVYEHSIAYFLSSLVQAIDNCKKVGNTDWQQRHSDRLDSLVKRFMPSGSGWDCGTTFWLEKSTPTKLVFHGHYHHMDDGGSYDGWTEHRVTVRPAFDDVLISISGPNRNEVKDSIHERFHDALTKRITHEQAYIDQAQQEISTHAS